MTTHPFDSAIELEESDQGLLGRTVPEYANMVGPFGGATAAALLRAVELHPGRAGDPVALTVNFAAPIADGEFRIDTTLARANRSNQHWMISLHQDGNVMSTATAVFGIRRETWSDAETQIPDVPSPESVDRTPGPEGVRFLQNYDLRFVAGSPPADGVARPSSTTTLWVRHDPVRELDFSALAALSDVFYPRIFLRRGGPVPAGTISMTVYFHVDGAELARLGDDYVLATATGQQFARGYFDQTAQLWSRDGDLLVTSSQVVYYKDSFGS
ncbi:acyl-CoA thioesterase [Mycobacterium barrassiae]|uniref:acyl-CoA thioesterase n=1 Tax=Mycobacterium barrassiae TaxID=319709 RepID=UPI002265D62C|nr:thioesterase family protein [Mycobacterium barrassiae]